MTMTKTQAQNIASVHSIPLHIDFHTLGTEVVSRIVEAAKTYGYRKPKNANGSTARYFYAYLCRAALGPKWGTEYVIQGNYGYGFEDESAEETRRDAMRSLKEYRQNGPGSYRMVTRRVKNFD